MTTAIDEDMREPGLRIFAGSKPIASKEIDDFQEHEKRREDIDEMAGFFLSLASILMGPVRNLPCHA